ncbi:diguanylate cyclase domain-containing protein [Saccharopolyspora sp. CA-218241]|uniref:diguanylate cyclase domain-containing protein n=1 Tax=Saccharopolyspora sp. CA-218241 TaxID=3240027 RepID=UPI003D98E314
MTSARTEGARWWPVVVIGVVGLAIAVVASGRLQPPAVWLVADAIGLVAAVAAGTAFAITAFRRPGRQLWRVTMAVAVLGWATGQAIWTWHRVIDLRPMTFPDIENIFFFMLPVGVLAAFVHIARTERSGRRGYDRAAPLPVLVLDCLIIIGGLAALLWETTYGAPTGQRRSPGEPLTMFYTITDLVLILLAMLVAITLHSLWQERLAWIIGGLLAIACSDAGYAYMISAGIPAPPATDAGYMLGPALLFIGATVPERSGRQRRTPALLALPYLPLAAVCGIVLLHAGTCRPAEIYFLVGIVILVVVRQLLTLRELYDAHDRLSHQATHDPLTGVGNRALLTDRLTAAHAMPRARALLYCDINEFKAINDEHGHPAGDELLRITAQRLLDIVRATDTVARIGGDEFVVLLDPAPTEHRPLIDRIAQRLAHPVPLRTGAVRITVSIGYHPLPPDTDPEQALAHADAAMYRAKRDDTG